jgi:secretion activator protein, putative
MARSDILAKFILSYEGGFINHPNDKGGETNKGVTIAVWKAQGYDKNGDRHIDVKDLKLISDADAMAIMRKFYWNRWQADKIEDLSIANLLVDFVWGSGAWGIKIPQRVLGVMVDGVVGTKTLAAINAQEPKALFAKLKDARLRYINDIIAKNPSFAVFRAGWLRRLNGIEYGRLRLNNGKILTF